MSDPIRIGECIYCGEKDDALTDEHAMPFALNGDLVLKKASCRPCATLTSKFELSSLRGMLGRARAKLKLKSRKKTKQNFAIAVNDGLEWKTIDFNASKYAGINQVPIFAPPAYLLGTESNELRVMALDQIRVGSIVPPNSALPKSTKVKLKDKQLIDAWAFGKMVAKIGYCCSIAFIGYENITEKFVLPAILGEKDDLPTWFGNEPLRPRKSNKLHEVQITVRDSVIYAHVWLFAAYTNQPYTVVIGKIASQD